MSHPDPLWPPRLTVPDPPHPLPLPWQGYALGGLAGLLVAVLGSVYYLAGRDQPNIPSSDPDRWVLWVLASGELLGGLAGIGYYLWKGRRKP
jgi:hypothetical protein